MKQYLNREYLLTNKEKIIKAAAIIILIVAAFFVFILGGNDSGQEMTIETKVDSGEESTDDDVSSEIIMVDVSGAVKEPKVVQLNEGSRVADAIEAAGGLTDNADTVMINQAAFLTDGEKIYVPEEGEDVTGIEFGSGTGRTSSKIDINTATSEELQTLSGIGPATAEKILQYRSDVGYFKSIEEIKNVNGIGDKTFDELKEYIKV